jgi:DNA-binding GntR family transcriptional regulator
MLTLEEVESIYQVREVLEGLACRLFAKRVTPSAMSVLYRCLDLMEKYALKRNIEKLVGESDAFYKVVLEGCGNKVVYSLIKLQHARITYLRAMTLSQEGRPFQSIKELRSLCEAFEKGDGDAAWDASTFHVRDAKSVVLRILQGQGDENGILPM